MRPGIVGPVTAGSDDKDAPEELSTAQIAEELNVTRQTVLNWKDRGLLPAPTVLHLGARGKSSVWPAYTLPLARFVYEALQGRKSVAQIAKQVRPLISREPSWIDSELANGKTIGVLIRELAEPST